jgi:antitoxin ParD1/3/4
MPTRNVNLTKHFDQFIEEGVSSGRFGNASEMVREGLRLLEQRDREDRARVEWLRGEVQKGIDASDRGESIGFASSEERRAYLRERTERVIEARQLKKRLV